MDRREFLRTGGAAAATLAISSSCSGSAGRGSSAQEPSADARVFTRTMGGDTVGILGYGCMRWQMIDGPDGHQVIDQNSVNELVDYALEHGVNYFDSAPVYLQGQSEEATAKALLRHPRESYLVATKMSNFRAWSLEDSTALYRRSLELYQTDYLDYYLLHSIGNYNNFRQRFEDNGLMEFLLAERDKGHIRHLGFSFHGTEDGFKELIALHDKYHWDFVQIQMNYVDWNNASGRNCNASYLYAELEKRDIPVVIMEPLLGGSLSNVPDVIAERLKTAEPSMSVASWAFRFAGHFPKVLTVLSGMTYMEHLRDNVATYSSYKPLSETDLSMLEDIAASLRKFPLIPCTACQYCMPCPYGLDIPGIFRHYNSVINAGTVPDDPEKKEFSRLRRRFLAGYSRSLEEGRSAEFCINCGKCVPACPQKIRIPQRMKEINDLVETMKNSL